MQLEELIIPLSITDMASRGIDSITGKLGALNIGALAVGAAFTALTGFLVSSVKAAADAEKIQAQLGAVLKSTGGVAGMTAKSVNDLATSLSKVTPFEDDAIVSGENLLLTFTNIGKNVFPDATKTILDMSQALGQDLKSSAIQLGKALQDPITGITALRRVGVNFSDSQQEVIKSLVQSGKLEEAQKLILKELQTEFGGSAEAAGKTFAGQLQILQNNLQNIEETVGGALLPVLTSFASTVSDVVDRFSQLTPEEMGSTIGRFLEWLPAKFQNWAERVDWKKVSQDIINGINSIDWATLGEKIRIGFGQIMSGLGTIVSKIDWVGIFAAIGTAFLNLLAGLTNQGTWENVKQTWSNNWNQLKEIVGKLLDLAKQKVASILEGIKQKFSDNWNSIKDTVIGIINDIIKAINSIPLIPDMGLIGGNGNSKATPGKASGGPVVAGQSYQVAEFNKPEIFTPNTGGRIDSANQSQSVTVSLDEKRMARAFAQELQTMGIF